jgi:hypothetical protein
VVRKAGARKTTAKKGVRKSAAKKVVRKTAKKTARKAAAKTPRKSAKKAARKAVQKAAPRKTAAKKAPTRKATRKSAATVPVKKAAPRRSRKATGITPEQALANTQALLQAKQEHDRQPPPWQALQGAQGQVPQSGFQSEEARAKASELHAAESRMDAIQGSIGTHDRHNQGKRDSRS